MIIVFITKCPDYMHDTIVIPVPIKAWGFSDL